jgi:hypothetical protein
MALLFASEGFETWIPQEELSYGWNNLTTYTVLGRQRLRGLSTRAWVRLSRGRGQEKYAPREENWLWVTYGCQVFQQIWWLSVEETTVQEFLPAFG